MASKIGNKKVALNRGKSWQKNMIKGKLEVATHPTTIKIKRVEKEISQSFMAQKMSLSLATYGSIERSQKPIKESLASFIASFLGLPFDKAFTKNGDKFLAIKVK